MASANWGIYIKQFRQYLKLERGMSEHTIDAYIRDVNKLAELDWVHQEALTPEAIQLEHIQALLSTIHDLGLGAKSQARIISGLRAFYNFLILEGLVDINPLELIEAPKLEKHLPEVLAYEEIQAIIQAIDMSDSNGHRNRAIIETLYACGLRVSELTNMRLSNYFPDIGFIRVIGKNDKERIIPIGQVAIQQINIYLQEIRKHRKIAEGFEDFIFLNRSGKTLTRVMIFTIIKRLKTIAGITKNISPHTFRHSFATHLIEGGANLRAIQDMLGHASITTTEIYTHLDNAFLRDTINQYHPRNQG